METSEPFVKCMEFVRNEESVLLKHNKEMELNYNFETWNPEWIENVLTSHCHSRDKFLIWVLQQLGLSISCSYSVEIPLNRIHKELMSVGICKETDSSIIKATVNSKVQLQFWKQVLQILVKIKRVMTNKHKEKSTTVTDNLLDSLLESSSFQEMKAKEGDTLWLLPEDLRKKFDIWEKSNNSTYQSQVSGVALTLSEARDQSSVELRNSKECNTDALCQSLTLLSKCDEELPKILESSIGPWCKETVRNTDAESSLTGELVRENHQILSTFMNSLKLEDEIKKSYAEMEEQVHNLTHEDRASGTAAILEEITSCIDSDTFTYKIS